MTPSLFLTTKRETYRQHVAAGQGAGITLVAACGEYVATFDCAIRCAAVLGGRELKELAPLVSEYRIQLPDIRDAIEKLSQLYSVALVDYCNDRHGARFVLVWRIAANNLSGGGKGETGLANPTAPPESPRAINGDVTPPLNNLTQSPKFVSLDEI